MPENAKRQCVWLGEIFIQLCVWGDDDFFIHWCFDVRFDGFHIDKTDCFWPVVLLDVLL